MKTVDDLAEKECFQVHCFHFEEGISLPMSDSIVYKC